MRYSRRERPGFALLAVLWVMMGVVTLGLATSLVARRAVAGAHNRVQLRRAAWMAEECVERARAAIDEVLTAQANSASERGGGWSRLDAAVATSPLLRTSKCDVSLRPLGSAVDIGSADAEMLSQLLAGLAMPVRRADSLVDALLDWRDRDDVARPLGAERDWYQAHGRLPPRNAPLADIRELARVRGFEALQGLDSVLTLEPGRIALNHAPLTVVAALPGFTPEAVARMVEHRVRSAPVTDLLAFAGQLSPSARQALLARYADLVRFTTIEPDGWILTARAKSGAPAVTAVLEVRLVRAGNRAAIVRRRTWIA